MKDEEEEGKSWSERARRKEGRKSRMKRWKRAQEVSSWKLSLSLLTLSPLFLSSLLTLFENKWRERKK